MVSLLVSLKGSLSRGVLPVGLCFIVSSAPGLADQRKHVLKSVSIDLFPLNCSMLENEIALPSWYLLVILMALSLA
jgi:hypothetical protein